MPKAPTKPRSNRQSKPRPRKAANLTCRSCRTRKIRCDGAQPHCGICIAYDEECIYDKAPPMTQVMAMADRIAELERVISELRRNGSSSSPGYGRGTESTGALVTIDSITVEVTPTVNNQISQDGVYHNPEGSSSSTSDGSESLDVANAYYNTTSSVHPPDTVVHASPVALPPPSSLSLPTIVRAPDANLVTLWEETAFENASILLNLPRETVRHLLATHWTWVHPTFIFVQRAMFLRDAAMGGEYFSPLLLVVICLHSTRFTEHHLTEQLLARARLLLSQEIHKDPSVPLVQALLQFSAREFGRGSISQAWLYSGMAFRMAVDLGLFAEQQQPRRHDQNELEDVRRGQIYRQLSWSCFIWDKIISLYLGRSPALSEPPRWEPNIPTLADDADIWRPSTAREEDVSLHGEAKDDVTGNQKSHTVSCFKNLCRLGVIINEVLFGIYAGRRTERIFEFVQEMRQKLQLWRSKSAEELRIDSTTQVCPPPHVVTQNLLYHATIILLHRPFRANLTCRTACREAAESIERLFLLLEQAFSLSRVTYAMAYCAYTAATVAVQDTKDGLGGARQRLDTCVRALCAIRASCPGIQRSIDIITKCMDSPTGLTPTSPPTLSPRTNENMNATTPATNFVPLRDAQQHQNQNQQVRSMQNPGEQMPTFPYQETGGGGYFPEAHLYQNSLFNSTYLNSDPQEWLDFFDSSLDQVDF